MNIQLPSILCMVTVCDLLGDWLSKGDKKEIYDINLITELNIVITEDEFDYVLDDQSKQVG